MSCGASAYCLNPAAAAAGVCSSQKPKSRWSSHSRHFSLAPPPSFSRTSSPPTLLLSDNPSMLNRVSSQRPSSVRRNCGARPGVPPPGENESRNVLEAFFLGKALAEALNERIESAVGEFLSAVGRLQAEQQKQVQDFQEEVIERAKKAREKAAREAMEAQGLIPTSAAANTGSATVDVVSSTPSSTNNSVAPASPPLADLNTGPDSNDPVVGVSNDE